jgi:hypothetical protein
MGIDENEEDIKLLKEKFSLESIDNNINLNAT